MNRELGIMIQGGFSQNMPFLFAVLGTASEVLAVR